MLFFIFCCNFFCIRLQTYAHTLMDIQTNEELHNWERIKNSSERRISTWKQTNKQTNNKKKERKKAWKQHTNKQIDRQNRKKERSLQLRTRVHLCQSSFSVSDFFVLGQNRNAKLDEYHWEDVPMHGRNNCKTIRKWDGEQIKN